jgi:hypothetical protein
LAKHHGELKHPNNGLEARHCSKLRTNPAAGFKTIKIMTADEIPTISGTVTPTQNGQQGPATTTGEPSCFSIRKYMFPTLRAQQQNILFTKSSSALPSATSLSHRVETAYL